MEAEHRLDSEQMRLLVYTARPAPLHEFIEFWAARYEDEHEGLYTGNINKSIDGLHTEETLADLFRWKLGFHCLAPKIQSSLRENFLSQIEKARSLPPDVSAEGFLQEHFPSGGAISQIFWLHCWHPDRFPIYDQHVHRAMRYIKTGKVEELKAGKEIKTYLQDYLPFFEPFRKAAVSLPFSEVDDGIRGRKADRALLMFGIEVSSGIVGNGS
jgi:hypothetical protein